MFETNFDIYNKSQKASIVPAKIKSSFDGVSGFLEVFIRFTYRYPSDYLLDILSVSAKLILAEKSCLLSQTNVTVGLTVPKSEYENGEWFKFKLEERFIKVIEDNRNGDPAFQIEIVALAATNIAARSSDGSIIKAHDAFHKSKGNLYFNIPKSIWVEKLLAGLGYQSFKLIQIPLTHKTLTEAYSDIIFEFNKAEEYFNQQDYDKCVAHCRSAMDALSRNLIKIRENTASESAFKWLEKISSHTFNWINEVNKANKLVSNKSHHSGHKNEFSKGEAESIYLTTLGLLHFISLLK